MTGWTLTGRVGHQRRHCYDRFMVRVEEVRPERADHAPVPQLKCLMGLWPSNDARSSAENAAEMKQR